MVKQPSKMQSLICPPDKALVGQSGEPVPVILIPRQEYMGEEGPSDNSSPSHAEH